MLELRPYQMEAIDSIFNYWKNAEGKNPLIVAPTASGKSIIIAEFCKRTCKDWRNVRIICVTHTRELISQNEKELRKHWEDASTGIYSAGLNKRQTQAQILFVGIQSVYNKAFSFDKTDIILVDEAHLIPREAQTRYGRFINDMRKANPKIVVVGLTATPYRLDSGMLHEGDDALFDGIAYCCEMKELIKGGYLVPVVSKGGVLKIDLDNVHIRAGDYASNELARAADDPHLIKEAVKEIVTYGVDRKAWLVFCAGVEHAEHVRKEFETHNITSAVVTGDTPKTERDRIVNQFKDGGLRCLVNVAVFTTGFNVPRCDLIALLMSTKSTGKYVQIVGRGMRTHPGKENCLLLDYGGNVEEHGMIDDVDPIRRKNVFAMPTEKTPVKECPQCRCMMHARTTICPGCGYEFPVVAPHGTEAYDGAVLSNQQKPMFVEVKDIWYSRHKKPGSPDILKISMFDAIDKEYPIWCCAGHDGYAKDKALQVIKQFGGTATNVTDALKESPYWRKPIMIKVVPNGKFWNVVGIEFHPPQPKQMHFNEQMKFDEDTMQGEGND